VGPRAALEEDAESKLTVQVRGIETRPSWIEDHEHYEADLRKHEQGDASCLPGRRAKERMRFPNAGERAVDQAGRLVQAWNTN
jgi:hypothetical protein